MVTKNQESERTGAELREASKEWFRGAKFGLFIHWGIYSVTGRGEWLRSSEQVPEDVYRKQIPKFTAQRFNPVKWAKLAKSTGMKYVVITTKHHDGFCMFDAKNTDWKVTNTPYGKDVLAELTKAFEDEGLKVGYYYSIMDWHHPDYLPRMKFEEASRPAEGHNVMDYIAYMREQLKQILTEYGEAPFVLWYDGGWMNMPEELGAAETNALARQWKPGLLINDRHHTKEDLITPEQLIPATGIKDDEGKPALWEACITMTSHWWGYDKNETNFKEYDFLIRMLVDIVSKGGNLLLNVGPRPDGIIQREFVKRMRFIGKWMRKYGEAIHGTTASPFNMLPFFGRATVKGNRLFLFVFAWPEDNILHLPTLKNKIVGASVFGGRGRKLKYRQKGGESIVKLPKAPTDKTVSVIAVDVEGVPEAEPMVIRPVDGRIELPILYADLIGPHGQRIRYEIEGRTVSVGNWYRAPDRISWDIEMPKGGEYELEIRATIESGEGGSQYEIYVNPELRPALAPNGKPWSGESAKALFLGVPEVIYKSRSTRGMPMKLKMGRVNLKTGVNKLVILLKDSAGHKGLRLYGGKLTAVKS